MTLKERFSPRNAPQVVFGMSDGITTALGLVTALAAYGHAVWLSCLGAAVSGTIGMAAGEWLSDGRKANAIAIGCSTGFGSLLLGIPFAFLHGSPARLTAIALALAGAAVIGWVKGGRPIHYAQTVACLATVYGATWMVTQLTGAS